MTRRDRRTRKQDAGPSTGPDVGHNHVHNPSTTKICHAVLDEQQTPRTCRVRAMQATNSPGVLQRRMHSRAIVHQPDEQFASQMSPPHGARLQSQ